MVDVAGITKTYRGRRSAVKALDGLDFTAAKGEVFGIIGPDGAGKTSLFRILTTLLTPDGGCARVNGLDTVKDYRAIRRIVGYMPGRFSLYHDLSVEENLRFFAAIFGVSIEANYSLIKDIYRQLEPFKTRKAGQLSGGMKQKLALCCALIHQPLVLFLDEPTTGVDAVSRKEFWEMLHRLKEKGITILVSTSYMDEAGLCDRVALLQNGHLLSVDTPAAIRGNFRKPLWAVKARETFRLLPALKAGSAVESCYPFGQYYHVILKPGKGRDHLETLLRNGGFTEVELSTAEPGIEDCFIALMKEV